MDEVKQFEQQVLAAIGSSPEITPEIKSQAQNNLIQIYQNLQTIQFCIEHFAKFEIATSKIFSFNLIFFWLKDKSDNLTPEILQVLQQFLFSSFFIDNFPTFPKEIATQLIFAQAQLIKHIFPTSWPSFFTDIIFCQKEDPQNLYDNYVNQFLEAFTNEVCQIVPYTFSLNHSLSTILSQQEIWNQIIQYSVQRISANDISGYHIFKNSVKFCSLSFFSEPAFQQLIMAGYSNPQAHLDLFIGLRNIIERPMAEDARQQLISAFVNPEMLVEIIKNADNIQVSIAVADLISSCLLYLQSFSTSGQEAPPIPIPYYTIAVNFIQMSDITASRTIYTVFSSLVRYPDLVIETDKILINRLVQDFSEPTVLDTFETTLENAEKYINTIVLSIAPNIPVLDLIESYVPSFNFVENPGLCSVLIYLVFKLANPIYKSGKIQSYLELFSTLFSAELPFSPPQILTFYLLEKCGVNLYNYVNSELLCAIITFMMQITMMDNMDPRICNHILSLFPTYQFQTAKQKKMDGINPQLLDSFIQSMKSNYAVAASKLIQTMEVDTKNAFNQKYIEFYAQTLSSSPDLNVYDCLLAYLSAAIIRETDSFCQIAFEMLETAKNQQEVIANSDTLTHLILAMNQMSKTLIESSFPLLFQCCTSLSSIQTLCSKLIEHSKAISGEEWMPAIIDYLYQTVSKIIDDYLVHVYMGNKSRETEVTIAKFFDCLEWYLNAVLNQGLNEYLSALIMNTLQLIKRLSNRLYNSWVIQFACLSFIYNLTKFFTKNPEVVAFLAIVAPPLFPLTLNIIYVDPFNLISDGWRRVMHKILSIHKEFYNKLGMDGNFFVSQFQQFGVPPEFTAKYVSQLPNELPDKDRKLSSNQIAEYMRQNVHDIYLFFRNLNV